MCQDVKSTTERVQVCRIYRRSGINSLVYVQCNQCYCFVLCLHLCNLFFMYHTANYIHECQHVIFTYVQLTKMHVSYCADKTFIMMQLVRSEGMWAHRVCLFKNNHHS